MSKKGKVCRECSKPLTGIRSQFCTDTCYKHHKQMRAKEVSHLRRRNFPQKDCYICGKLFQPIREDHRNCSKSCTFEDARNRRIAKRKKQPKLPRVKPMESSKLPIIYGQIETHRNPILIKSRDPRHIKLNSDILDFLAKGGEIKKFPDELNGKTPTVNFSFGFDIDSSLGFGMELNSTQLLEDYDRN